MNQRDLDSIEIGRLRAHITLLREACATVLSDLTHPDTDESIRTGPQVAVLQEVLTKTDRSHPDESE